MISVIFVHLLILNIVYANDECLHGWFRSNSNNNGCAFYCSSFSESYYISLESLTFDFIRERCDNVRLAAEFSPDSCNSKNDLVWPTNRCGCPVCKCSQVDDTNNEMFVDKGSECISCNCIQDINKNYDSKLMYSCSSVMRGTQPYQYDLYSCPPVTCTDEYNISRNVGDGWLAESIGCNRYCICQKDGKIFCELGYKPIVSSKNELLYNTFVNQCEYYIQDVKFFNL